MDRAVRLTVSYDGTGYSGWQSQGRRLETVQGVLQDHLTGLCGPGRLLGASRTDAGVHADGQVAVWRGPCPVPLERLAVVVNRRLPASIRVRDPGWVSVRWDPGREATAKQYSYRLWRGPSPCPPWWARYTYESGLAPDWRVLQEAAALFLGAHDFWAFRSEGSSAKTTERRVLASRWQAEAGGRIWRYQVVADGFLYHMVRIMVGSMLAAAATATVEPIRRALAGPGTTKMGPLAPAQGLMLDWIAYREEG
ncbi:MAG: tRNA pseudouridine synthase A [Thermaerobacter sp.]|nr:tRNA pseudouridine synthase A [Thermaerobacter sp.]